MMAQQLGASKTSSWLSPKQAGFVLVILQSASCRADAVEFPVCNSPSGNAYFIR
jgi:hypothetical protein